MSRFTERLEVTLQLTIAGKVYAIRGGDVNRIALDLQSHGWEGELEFWVAQDKEAGGLEQDQLLGAFTAPDLVEIDLSIRTVHTSAETPVAPEGIAVRGIVREKSLQERAFPGVDGTPVLYRCYGARCGDAAQVLWRQHFPVALYTGKSLREVIEAERGPMVTVRCDWDVLDVVRPLVFLGLDPSAGSASFYDFVLWTVDRLGGAWTHDYATQTVSIAAEKAKGDAPAELPRADVDTVRIHFPEVARHSVTVRNASAPAARSDAIAQNQAVEGVRRDLLMRSPVAKAVDDRVALETRRLRLQGEQLELRFGRMPSVTLRPGEQLTFTTPETWSTRGQPATRTWRVCRVQLDARADDPRPDADHLAPSTHYAATLDAWLEGNEDPFVRLPAFTGPPSPQLVEGIVASEGGEETEETWQVATDEESALETINVEIPVFDDQKVKVAFSPLQATGHLFLPPWKGARVLVALGVESATFAGFLDWKAGARLPADGQGAGILLGKTPTSSTALSHTYDGEVPTFRLARTHGGDVAEITLSEGALTIHVKTDDGAS